ncbi:MAG: SRPBCC family protein [Promethearchaeota archaeon]
MTHITEAIEIHAPLEQVFHYAANHRNAAKFIASVTSYDPTTEAQVGVGARFAMGIKVLDFRFTQELEVIELEKGRFLHVKSISGQPFTEAKWHFKPTSSGTHVTYEVYYLLPERFLGKQLDKAAQQKLDGQIKSDARQTLTNLKAHLENK